MLAKKSGLAAVIVYVDIGFSGICKGAMVLAMVFERRAMVLAMVSEPRPMVLAMVLAMVSQTRAEGFCSGLK